MATTLRVDGEVKRAFDRLQGEVQARTGERVSQSELLRKLIAVVRRHEAELYGEGRAPWSPPTPEELSRLRSRIEDWGFDTDSSRIDEVLYGGEP